MKKEALIRILESTELPDLLIAGHKNSLRKVLLEGAYAEVLAADRGKASPGNIFNGWLNWLRAPAWRMAAASGLAIFVVAAVLSLAFYLSAPSPSVIAADVVKRDPGIQQRLNGTGEIIIMRVDVRDGMASVICGRCMGDLIEADVDMNVKTVVSARRYEGLFMPELTQDARDDAIKIAVSDPRMKSIMDRGGSVERVFPIFSSVSNMSVIGGSILKVTPAAAQAIVSVQLDGKTWLALVNVEQGCVERITEPEAGNNYYYEIFFGPQNL
ncbi:MAG: hypothetical protein PHU70_09340 [Dehalococcoidia bacterium]|nr:hypothetical protein [Dehalococcoidia bacterium]MDD5648747.1 hypothetical protein [Dehalococcoidia bacterium]